jgi:hypothetical protein
MPERHTWAIGNGPAGCAHLLVLSVFSAYLTNAHIYACLSLPVTKCMQGGHVVITCNTQQPYIHCLEVPSSSSQDCQVVVQGISFEHYSKSVANNYCIFAQVRAVASVPL